MGLKKKRILIWLIAQPLTLYQTTNFRLFQPERVADDNLRSDENGSKFSKKVENSVGEKEKLLIMRNFSFSHSVFKRLVLQTLNPFPNKPWFLRVCSASLLKTLREKEKLLLTSNFSFSHSVFEPFGEFFAIFIKFEIVFCKLFQFGRV